MSDYQLYQGDCLDILPTLAAGSVDAVICDPPYGTTACSWDSVIPFEPMWEAIKHVLKPRGACVLFGSQPFTSALVMSNVEWFKYSWVWEKSIPSNIANATRMVMKWHEDICVFCSALPMYNPQKTKGKPNHTMGRATGERAKSVHNPGLLRIDNFSGIKHPKSVIKINNPRIKQQHPTQKPVALMEYLIRTYTNEGDTVLDFCAGSGSTGVAAVKNNRRFIGIELDPDYFQIAQTRIANAAGDYQLTPKEKANGKMMLPFMG